MHNSSFTQNKMFAFYKWSPRTIRRKIVLGFTTCFIIYIYVYIGDSVISTDLVKDVSCHYYSYDDDAIKPADDNYSPSPKSIFLHETSCKRHLTARQLCTVESASRAHPDREIHVLFSSPISDDDLGGPTFQLLALLHNVKFARVNIIEYAKGTPLEALVSSGALMRSQWAVPHTSDVLRLMTLYKWLGVYLDMDFVVAKDLDALGENWAARESADLVGSSALAFADDEIGRRIAVAAVREIQATFNGHIWINNGPGVITRVLKKLCRTDNVTLMSAAICGGFEVYGPELIYPVKWQHAEEYFKPGELKNKDAYLYHIWNYLTSHFKVHRGSPYAKLAERYCPLTYEFYNDEF